MAVVAPIPEGEDEDDGEREGRRSCEGADRVFQVLGELVHGITSDGGNTGEEGQGLRRIYVG